MKKIKVRLSETKKRPGRSMWNILIESNKKKTENKEKNTAK
jgi:hypothetical protein